MSLQSNFQYYEHFPCDLWHGCLSKEVLLYRTGLLACGWSGGHCWWSPVLVAFLAFQDTQKTTFPILCAVEQGHATVIKFCYFWAEASKSQLAILLSPFLCLGAPLKLHGDTGVMRLKKFGEVEGNCPRESPGPTGDFV